ncbi:hypothetical protein CMI42_00860 [Candidatus Pacearchaeota archaeon]|nr:hypothetical protein [Candidatus Pacearchaeota archaeon]
MRKLCREKGIILKKTGKRFPHGYWDKEKVIKEIQKIKNEKGDLSARVCSLNRRPLFKAAIKCFKSWENAIIESGIDYNKILKQKKWTKKEIIDEIKKLYKKGAIISHKNMRKIRKDIVFSAERYFRTYANAVISAGIDYYGKIAIIKNKYWTDERIVHKIKEIHKKGISLSSRLIQLEYSDLFAVACKRFGSWEEAVFKSGISYKEITNRKYKHECDDGTRVSSIPEMQFCNRLMKNKTGYEYETLFSSKRKYTTDFKVGRFNFEVLGWWNHKDENRRIEYRERYKDKIKHWISEKGARFIYCFGHEIDKYLPYIKTSKMPVVIGVIPKDNQFKERDLNKILNPLIKLKLIN